MFKEHRREFVTVEALMLKVLAAATYKMEQKKLGQESIETLRIAKAET